jgi:protein-S-isoprenylcysteine O-methyltransferase Ste14
LANSRRLVIESFYKYRGLITALFGAGLLALPAAEFEFFWLFGFLIFGFAVCLRVWARMYIGEHSRGEELACPELVSEGPYRYIKHPLYVSNFMTGAAFAILHTGWSFTGLGLCGIYGAFLVALAVSEDKFLGHRRARPMCLPHVPHAQQPIIKSIINDRYTWVWQIIILAGIFLQKL